MVDAPASKRGFTLIELLVTMAVAAILVTIAVPNFQTFVMNSRMASQTNDLVTALSLARSEAVKRASDVTVCASSDGASCTGGLQQGWLVFADGGTRGVIDSGDTLLRVQPALAGSSTLTGGTNSITYDSSGRLDFPATAVTLTLCPPSPAVVQGRAIQIERTGRTRFAPVACT